MERIWKEYGECAVECVRSVWESVCVGGGGCVSKLCL